MGLQLLSEKGFHKFKDFGKFGIAPRKVMIVSQESFL
jgi:hypothetical protein